jgi:hypothetical protein
MSWYKNSEQITHKNSEQITHKKITMTTQGQYAGSMTTQGQYAGSMTTQARTVRSACPKSGPEFPMPYVMVFFMFNDLWLEAIVYYVDIDGIVDHHCLSFYFIIQVKIIP